MNQEIQPNFQYAHTCKIGLVQKRRLLIPLSESEIALQTYININFIQAKESGNYLIFLVRIFAVKYFRKYADFFGSKLKFFDTYNLSNS
jgi:hypothetical protein